MLGSRHGPLVPSLPTLYTASYCEENVYHLVKRFSDPEILDSRLWSVYTVFISNHSRSVVLWHQRASKFSEASSPVCWDYHVIAVLRPQECNKSKSCWVYDFDTLLPRPCSFEEYIEHTFQPSAFDDGLISQEFKSILRLVNGATFLEEFASDRSHMKLQIGGGGQGAFNDDLAYLAPCPDTAVIQGSSAKLKETTHNLMTDFVAMDVKGFGNVMELDAFISWGGIRNL